MDTPYPFEPLLVFGFLSIMLLVGVLARVKIRFFQKFLFPSCIIGGILGMILVNVRVVCFQVSHLESFAYHLFNISFISVGLTSEEGISKDGSLGREYMKGPVWMALLQGSTFSLQIAVGGILTLALGLFGIRLFKTFGFLVALGFTEGPGQALSIGKMWESFGFQHGSTIGLIFAALGYFFCFFTGIPLLNWGIKKGYSAHTPKQLTDDFLTGIVPKEQKKESAGELTTHTGNIESAAFQAAFVGLVYVLTYYFVRALGGFLAPENAKILWGFFFLFGLGVALIVRFFMKKTGIERLLNPGIQKRITGWSIDFMIVATVTAIQVRIVYKFMLPIILIAASAGSLTLLVVLFFGRRLWSFNLERIAAIYGTVTGTCSTGLLLLRVVDPDFKTPVAIELAIMNVFSIPVIGVCTVLMNAPLWWSWSVGLTVLVYVGIAGVCAGLIRLLKLYGRAAF